MPQLLVLVKVGGPQLKYDYFGGRGLERLRTTGLDWRGHFLQVDKRAGAQAPFDV